MDELFRAITARFRASALAAQISGGLHDTRASQGTRVPYVVLSMPVSTPNYTFDTAFEQPIIQFDLYVLEGGWGLLTAFLSLYDDCDLAMPGYDLVRFEREMTQKITADEGKSLRYLVQYRVNMERL